MQRIILSFLLLFLCSVSRADNVDDLLNFSKKKEEALIVKVVNSDLVVLENGQRVKLIGIESAGLPPRKYVKYDKNGRPIEEPEEPVIPIEEQAITYAQSLMEGKKVKLENDIDARSPDGYRYAYIYLPDGKFANAELLRMGFVRLKTVPPNVKHAQELREAYQEARREKRGLEGE